MSEAARPNKCLHLPDALMKASKPETLTAEEAIMRNQKLQEVIDELKQNGKLAVYCWSRDCDQYESDSMDLIPATVTAYQNWEDHKQDNREGPCRTYPVSMNDYNSFEASFRDRRAEQYNY